MPLRLASALSVSVLLIGIALWFRFDTQKTPPPSLVVVEQPQNTDERQYEEFLKDFITPKSASTTVESKPLTNTDLISRGLILDYVGLAGSGQANIESIDAIALKHVESIRTLAESEAITMSDIRIVSDVSTNYQNYKDSSRDILEDFSVMVGEAYGSGVNLTEPNADLYAYTDKLSEGYRDTAIRLRAISAPNSLATYHVELVNLYLSNASAMSTISQLSTDAAVSFAGIIVLNENLQREKELVEQMGSIIEQHGI